MDFRKILLENKVDDFKKKYLRKFGDNTQRIVDMVYPKYLEWVGKNLENMDFPEKLIKVGNTLDKFEKISQNLPKTDINQYQTIQELLDAISKWENRTKREFKQVNGGNLVYEDERFYVVNPLTHEASCYYGKGTKWCTTAEYDYHFKNYNEEGKLFYIIDKKLKNDDPFYKVAILKNFDGGEQYWDAIDRQFTQGWILKTEEYKKIQQKIDEYLNKEFAEQIKIYTDKEAARLERERVYRVRIQREREQREAEAESRREDNEWELGPNTPDEGLKAHALLLWLADTSDVGIKDIRIQNEIDRIQEEIDELNDEYESSEDPQPDLLDEISDLEQEMEDLISSNLDVYDIIPTGDYYDMTSFIVLNPNLEGREYAVGTYDETHSSCVECVEQLIDDVGYDGFSSSFVQDYLDEDAIVEEARDFYDNDVRDSGESYFDENDRELSRKQEEQIRINNDKIDSYRQQIENLNSLISDDMDEDEREDIEDKVSEIEDLIYELESDIESIQESPEGDFPESMIDEKVEELLDNVRYDPKSYLDDMGLDFKYYIDKEKFIEGVIDADGFGYTLSTYDGNVDEVSVQGTTYYVLRQN